VVGLGTAVLGGQLTQVVLVVVVDRTADELLLFEAGAQTLFAVCDLNKKD
jgi:hypothetical protein